MAFLQDLYYGFRVLLQSPVATAVAVLALALGIGVNISSFVGVNAVILHPFPFPHLDRIMTLWETPAKSLDERRPFAPANFLDWQRQSGSFQAVAAYQPWDINLTGSKDPLRVQASQVSADFFNILGAKPLLGRTFSTADTQSPGARAVVISNGFWRQHFAAAPDTVGKSIWLGGERYFVAGVMPDNFNFPLSCELWAPLNISAAAAGQRSIHTLQVLALLKPDTSVEAARTEAREIAHRLQLLYPATNEALTLRVVPIRDLVDEVTDRFMYILLGCATFVLLLAAANVGNLQIARAAGRQKEIAVRAALGASRFQIARQLIAESLLISAAGGVVALFLASWNLDLAKANIPAEAFAIVAGLRDMRIDGPVLAYTFVISLLTGLLASLPAIFQLLRQNAGANLHEALQKGGRTSATSSGVNGLQSVLIGYEVAMALVLLVGAGLMVKAFNGILVGSYGYDPKNILRLQVSLPAVKYSSEAQLVAFYDRTLDRFQSLPGAQSAAVWSDGPNVPVLVEGRPAPRPGELQPELQSVSSAYLRTMRVPLLDGRFFSAHDRPATPLVAVISASVARTHFPHSNPIGQRIKLGTAAAAPWLTIVGVSGDIVRDWFTNRPAPLVFVPYTQQPLRATTFVVRSFADPRLLASAAQAGVRKIDRDLPLYEVKSMDRYLYDQTSGVRAAADNMSTCAVVALLLAATGIFGVISYFVAQRTRDIGVYMALGANAADVLKMTVRKTLYPAVIGLAIGAAAAYGLSEIMGTVLFHFVKIDSFTFLACIALLAATALLASYIPARRAARIDPLIALRDG